MRAVETYESPSGETIVTTVQKDSWNIEWSLFECIHGLSYIVKYIEQSPKAITELESCPVFPDSWKIFITSGRKVTIA